MSEFEAGAAKTNEERIAGLVASNRALRAWATDEQRGRHRAEEQRTDERGRRRRTLRQAICEALPKLARLDAALNGGYLSLADSRQLVAGILAALNAAVVGAEPKEEASE